MYNEILDGLYANRDIRTEIQKQTFLEGLQQTVRDLRREFKNYPVNVDYTNENNQAAYLLCYIPHYTDLLFKVLNETDQTFFDDDINELMLFGSGPCPEIIGYLRYLNQFDEDEERTINLTVYDISVDEWLTSRNIIFDNAVPLFVNNRVINRKRHELDITEELDFEPTTEKRLIVFQNCLNEVTEESFTRIIENIKEIFEESESGSYLAIIDLDFDEVKEFIVQIEDEIISEFDCEVIRSGNDGTFEHRTTQTHEPRIILNHLLTDTPGVSGTGLLYKRKNNFAFTLIKKN